MKPEIITIFVEDYKKMSKADFSEYIKQIYQQGYDKGYSKGYLDGNTNIATTSLYNNPYATNVPYTNLTNLNVDQ